jgi:serine protease
LPAVEAAVTYAFNRGVVVVAGAGNDNAQGPRAPASCTHALAVGGSGSGNTVVGPGFPGEINERASFSNFGRAPGQSHGVDVVAPAVHIAAPRFCTQGYVDAGVAGCTFAGETPSDRIVLASGNSLSGPLVAGLAALIISRARDLGIDITPGQVKDIIRNTARNLPNDPNDTPDAGASWDGKGRVDFLRAVLSVWPSTLGRR